MKGLVSVIIPYYNAEKYIGKCIDSVVKSTYKNIEIIVVGDSRDEEGKCVLGKLSKIYPQVRFLIQNDYGLPAARNFGISHAKGEFFTLIDADDFIEENYIKKMIDNIGDNDVIIGGYNEIFENYVKTRIPSKKEGFQYKFMTARGKIYRTDIIKSNKLEFIKMHSEDIIFSMELYNITDKVIGLPYVGYNYISNPTSLVHTIQYDDVDTFTLISIILKKCKNKNSLMLFSLYKILLLDLKYSFSCFSFHKFLKHGKKMFRLFGDNKLYVNKYNHSEPFFINASCLLLSLFIYIFN